MPTRNLSFPVYIIAHLRGVVNKHFNHSHKNGIMLSALQALQEIVFTNVHAMNGLRKQMRQLRSRPDGITLIIIYYLVTGVLSLLAVFFGLALGTRDANLLQHACGAFRLLSLPFAMFALVSSGLLYGIVALATGWGMLNYHAWARWIAIALAALGMINFPIGTVIGAVMIWYLFQRKVSILFK